MLTQKQARKLERDHKLQLFYAKTENVPVVASFKPYAKEVALFNANVEGADAAASGKEVKPSPEDEKTELKHEISKDLSRVCLSTKSYAMTYANPTLAAAMNAPESDIFAKKDEDIQPFFVAQNALITPLFNDENYADYEVTADVMSNIGKKVTKFHSMIGLSGVNQTDYTVANTAVDKWLTATDGNIDHFELLITNFEDKYPGFVEGYHANARLGNKDVRHSGIEGAITKKGTGAPVANAVISLENTTKVAVSNLPGDYRLAEVKPGWYNILVTIGGTEVIRLLHQVNRGKIDKLNFEV